MTTPPQAPPRPQPGWRHRWIVLFFMSLAMFGNYYLYDSIAPVADLLTRQLGFSDAQYGFLYTIYSIAAFLVLLIGGIIIDRIGTAKSTFIFGVICAAAGILMIVSREYWVMASARFLLGVGAEPLIVAVTTGLAKWFKGKELSLAFGVNLTIARLGSALTDYSPSIAPGLYDTWREPLVLAAGLGMSCVVGAVFYWVLESRAERRHQIGKAETTDKLAWADMFRFDRSYWYIVGLCVVFYSVVFPFRAFAIKFFIEAYDMNRQTAGLLNGFLPVSAMIATPLFGLLVDRVGRRSLFMLAGSAVLLPLFLTVIYAPPGPNIAFSIGDVAYSMPLTVLLVMIILGVVFSLIPAVMWPSVAYIVEQWRLGTGYALMTFCQQVGVAAVPWAVGALNDAFGASPQNPEGYFAGMWLFTALAAFGLVFSLLLWRAERGPHAHGLETITTRTPPPTPAQGVQRESD